MSMTRLILATAAAIVVTLLPLRARAQTMFVDKTGIAYVDKTQVEFVLPQPELYGPQAFTQALGHYAWRVVIDDRSDASFVLAPDTAMQSHNLTAIVKASRLRLCANAGVPSALDCTEPFTGKVKVYLSQISVVITDAAFLERIRRIRPGYFWLRTFWPPARFEEMRLKFIYRDKPLQG